MRATDAPRQPERGALSSWSSRPTPSNLRTRSLVNPSECPRNQLKAARVFRADTNTYRSSWPAHRMGRCPERANHPRCAHAPHAGATPYRSFEKFRRPRRAQQRGAGIALVGIGAIRRHDRRGDHGANALRIRSGNGEKFCRVSSCETSQAWIDRRTHEYRVHSRFLVRHPSR